MAKKPGRFCKAWGCGEIVRGGSLCEEHLAERRRQHDENRGTSTARGYGAAWRRARKLKLMRTPICEDPFAVHQSQGGSVAKGEVVDHIIPLSQGGTHAFDNLQTLCAACHNRKTASEDGGFGNRRGRGAQIPGSLGKQNRAGGFEHAPAKSEQE